jgi:CDP-diacylglycerol--serine O-phosphatidyltransferase
VSQSSSPKDSPQKDASPKDVSQRRRKRARRYARRRAMEVLSSVPLLPSLITLANAFCGVLVIVKVVDLASLLGQGPLLDEHLEKLEFMGLLILLAMFFDALDGKVARLTSQTSDFGAQLDSLSDAITFGVAPAVLCKFLIDMHATGPDAILPAHPKLYYACAAVYVLAAVMRLARFQVLASGQDREEDHLMFKGLPSPAAALVLTSLVLFYTGRGSEQALTSYLHVDVYRIIVIAMPFALAGAGILMVSTFSYPHFANLLAKRKQSFLDLAMAVFILILAALEWQAVALLLAALYVILGPLVSLWRKLFGIRDEDDEDLDDEEDLDEQEEELLERPSDEELREQHEVRPYPGPGSRAEP